MNKFIKLFCISLLVAVSASRAMNEEEHKQLGLELIAAAMDGNLDRATELLDRGADLNQRIKNGCTPLTWAASRGHEAVAQLLLDRKAKVNQANSYGCTPLARAAINGHVAVVRLLLKHGANPNQVDNHGETPLVCAAIWGHVDVVCLLLEHGANVNQANNDGWTSLMMEASKGRKQLVQLLLNPDADLHQANNNGYTALMLAAANGYVPTCELLVETMLRQQIPSKIQKNRWYTFLACLRNNSDETIRCAYTPCILDIFKEYLRANIPAENAENPEESLAHEEIKKIKDEDEGIKQELLAKYIYNQNK